MFICGGPVYVAGITTSAINLSLIMALSPIVVLLFSCATGREAFRGDRLVGMALRWPGLADHHQRTGLGRDGSATGDLLALLAMLGWAGYT